MNFTHYQAFISTSFIDKCFKTFLDQLFIKKPQVLTVEKKTLTLVLPFLGNLSLQTKTKLQNVLKRVLGCCKIQIVFKSQMNLSNVFRFKDRLPYELISRVVYKFQCGRCNSSYIGETDRHLKFRRWPSIKLSRRPKVQYVIIYYSVIIVRLLMISLFRNQRKLIDKTHQTRT